MKAQVQLIRDTIQETNWLYDNEYQLWVRKGYLTDTINIDLNTLETGCSRYKRGLAKSWAYEMKQGVLWLTYEDLPTLQRQRIEDYFKLNYYGKATDVYGAASEAVIKHRLIEAAHPSDDARYFMSLPVKKGDKAFTAEQAQDLAKAASILRGVQDIIDSTDYAKGIVVGKTRIIKTSNEFIEWIATIIKSWKIYGLNIGNGRVLRKRLQEFREHGRDSLISAKHGNNNAVVLSDDIVKHAIVLYGSWNKPTFVDTAQEINRIYGLEVTPQALEWHLKKPEHEKLWKGHREGKLSAKKYMQVQITGRQLDYPDQLWQVDATTVQLGVQNEKGHLQKCAFTRVLVQDVYSGCFIGFAWGLTENADLVRSALYYAMNTYKRLPEFIKSDKASANTRKDLQATLDMLGIITFQGQAYRATSKHLIERSQNVHELNLQKLYPNFYGGNITGRGKQKRFNPDTLKSLEKKGQLPNDLQAVMQDYIAIWKYNTQKGKDGLSPYDKYTNVKTPFKAIELKDLVNVFYEPRKDMVYYEQSTLDIKVGDETRRYWVGTPQLEDPHFKNRYDGNRFRVKYDPQRPEVIGLYSEKWEFISLAVQKHGFHPVPNALSDDERRNWRLNLDNEKALQATKWAEYETLKQELDQAGQPTHVDFMIKSKADMANADNFFTTDAINQLAILDTKRQKVDIIKKEKTTPSVSETKKQHFFADDELAQSLLD